MSTFKLKKEMLADFPELAEQMREMNINRVSYVGLTFFFFFMLHEKSPQYLKDLISSIFLSRKIFNHKVGGSLI